VDSLVTVNYSYDDNDRLISEGATSYTYDANGNTLSKDDGSLTSYSYDYDDRLVHVQSPTNMLAYGYDVNGIRQSVSVDGVVSKHLVDSNRDYAQVIEERDSSDNLQVAYTYGDDLISQDRGGSVSYYHYDGLGSTRVLTDGSESTTDSYTYEAFGSLIRSTGTTPNSYLYTGEQYDPNTGFYYLRARYMNPENGRFLTTDPFKGLEYDPVTLHKYIYSGLDPVNKIDPSGKFFGGFASIGIRGILTGIGSGIRFGILAIVRGLANVSRFMFGGRPIAIGGRSVTWGFWRDLPKVVRAGTEYAIVRGRLFTRHAVERMTPRPFGTAAGGYAGRGVSSMVVEEVILFGRVTGRTVVNGYVRIKRTLGEISVVTEGGKAYSDIVVTVLRHSIK
jgi:RHS repeat-associated protein